MLVEAARAGKQREVEEHDPWFVRMGTALSNWTEKWWPNEFALVLVSVLIVALAAMAVGSTPMQIVDYYGSSFWSLLAFTLQAALMVVFGYVVASAPPTAWLIGRIASFPKTPKGAVAYVAFFAILTSLFNWAFSLIFSGFLVRAVAARVPGMDVRAATAAGYLGLGATWALGLSSSAALLMNTKESIPPGLLKISGIIPLSDTIFTWQSMVLLGAISLASIAVAYLTAPSGKSAKTAEKLGVDTSLTTVSANDGGGERRPSDWLIDSPVLPVVLGLIGAAYLLQVFANKGIAASLDLNVTNFILVTLGLLLHFRLRSFLLAATGSAKSAAGILISYMFYAGIFGIITKSPLSDAVSHFFISISSQATLPLNAGIYSAVLGFFVPSGGGKWILEAPYVLKAAVELQVNLGWIVQTYNAAEALPNLLNPFWMLPILGIVGLKARDIAGYCLIQFLVHTPLVLVLLWGLGLTLEYKPPIL